MKILSAVLFVFGIALTGCKQGDHNKIKEPDAAMINKEHPAEITFDEETVNAGEVAVGEEVVKEFTFTNTGKSPLIIVDVHTTCGCTVPNWPKDPIEPGKTSSIKVQFKSQMQGIFKKEITVSANTYPDAFTKVYLEVDVKG